MFVKILFTLQNLWKKNPKSFFIYNIKHNSIVPIWIFHKYKYKMVLENIR